MLIDTFTIVAQIINFLILVFLLWRFLYRPVMNAMDERERTVTSRLEEAGNMKLEAQQVADTYHGKMEDLDRKYDEMIAEARGAADTRRRELITEAREEVDGAKSRWYEALGRERDTFLRELRRQASDNIYRIARKILTEMADEEIENKITGIFISKLGELGDSDRGQLRDSITRKGNTVLIRSAYDLSEQDRTRLSDSVRKIAGPGISIEFRKSEKLLAGIELSAEGHKIAWNINDYLESLEESIGSLLDRKISAATISAPPATVTEGEDELPKIKDEE